MLFHKATSTQCCIFFCKRFRVSRLPATSGAGAGCEQPLKDKLTLHSIFFPPCVTDLTQLLSTIVAAVLPSFSLILILFSVGGPFCICNCHAWRCKSLPPSVLVFFSPSAKRQNCFEWCGGILARWTGVLCVQSHKTCVSSIWGTFITQLITKRGEACLKV